MKGFVNKMNLPMECSYCFKVLESNCVAGLPDCGRNAVQYFKMEYSSHSGLFPVLSKLQSYLSLFATNVIVIEI
jgi:predicted  nucleic acid-binding Zn-ribbon protein